MQPTWIVMPVLAGPEMTEAAISDCLAQSVPTRLLVINQGVDDDFRRRLERIAEAESDRVFLWSHEPPLPSLSASWNRALDFVWECGGEEALVVNNDVRLRADTVEWLSKIRKLTQALFVSAVGVRQEQFDSSEGLIFPDDPDADHPTLAKGGPDFSCYLISCTCHEQYRFDEAFIPAFCEDLDFHRRLMLDGHGDKIFSVNLPFLHLSSQTLKQVDPQKRMKLEKRIAEGSRKHYRAKWGGDVNQETFNEPFNVNGFEFTNGSMTTPALQAAVQGKIPPPSPTPFDLVQADLAAGLEHYTAFGVDFAAPGTQDRSVETRIERPVDDNDIPF